MNNWFILQKEMKLLDFHLFGPYNRTLLLIKSDENSPIKSKLVIWDPVILKSAVNTISFLLWKNFYFSFGNIDRNAEIILFSIVYS